MFKYLSIDKLDKLDKLHISIQKNIETNFNTKKLKLKLKFYF